MIPEKKKAIVCHCLYIFFVLQQNGMQNEHTHTNKKNSTHFIPWWKSDNLLVLQMIKSAHCTTTIDTKKAVWQVYSKIFLWL